MGRFKKRLRDLRIESGYTQTSLGQRLSISRSTISMYESGKREPDFQTLENIADLFHVDMNYLFGVKAMKNPNAPKGNTFENVQRALKRIAPQLNAEQKQELILALLNGRSK